MASAAALVKPVRKVGSWFWDGGFDPQELRYAATINVWVRWFWVIGGLIEINYPAGYLDRYYVLNTLYVLAPTVLNGYCYYRLRVGRTLPVRWLLGLSAMDVFIVSFSVSVSGGFDSKFYPIYLLTLAMFAVIFTSVRLSWAWTTLAAAVYSGICWTAGGGLDLAANEEKHLFIRLLLMYGITLAVSLIARYERVQRREAVVRSQLLQQERIELSHTIHDTVGQSAYMIGMGIDSAKALAGTSNPELTSSLEATGKLARSAMWSLRHPIDVGVIFDGQGLGTTLGSHVATFTSITSIPAEVRQVGTEPPLSVATKSLLFSIAHNALTNVFRHAEATRVEIVLEYKPDRLRISVCDDGRGLPVGYDRHGHGFRNMRTNAERIGGSLQVSTNEGGTGTVVVFEQPLPLSQGDNRNDRNQAG